MDGFEIRITHQIEGVKSSNIAGVKTKTTELWKLVDELYERPVYPTPILGEILSEEEIKNIWAVDNQALRAIRKVNNSKQRKRRRTEDEEIEVAIIESLQYKKD